MYIYKLDDIVNEYKMHIIEQLNRNLLMLKVTHILTLVKKLMIKILNFKLVIMEEYQNNLNKGYTPNWSEEVFVIKKS